MGKRLIIKDADFSANAVYSGNIHWYYRGFSEFYGSESGSQVSGTNSGGWSLAPMFDALRGKTINIVKGLAAAAGTFNFYKVAQEPNTVTQLPERSAYITIQNSDVGKITTFTFNTPVSLADNEYLVCGENGLSGGGNFIFLYRLPQYNTNRFYYGIGQQQPLFSKAYYEWFDYGFDDSVDNT